MRNVDKQWCGLAAAFGILVINFVLMFIDVIPNWWYKGYFGVMSVETVRLMDLWITGVCLACISAVSLYYYLFYGRHNDR